MVTIDNIDSRYFKLNGIRFPKIYQPLAQGSDAIGLYSIYDTRQQLVNSTKYTEFRVNGAAYTSQKSAIVAILDVVWGIVSQYDVELLENRVDNLEQNQVTGVQVYSTYAELPATGTLLVSYKVSNDSTASNNGYYHWTGSAYLKDADLYTSTLDDTDTAEAVTGKAVGDYSFERIKNDVVNLFGVNVIQNALPALSGFLTGQGISTYDELIVEETLPVNTNTIFRANYAEIAEGRIDLASPNDVDLIDGKGIWFAWVRKTDIANLPDSLTFMMYTRNGTTIEDIIKLDYIAKANFVKGFTDEKAVGSSKMKLVVLSETSGWLLFYAELTTTSGTADNFIPRFYFNNVGAGQEDKLDFVNYTAFSGQDGVNILLPSEKTSQTVSVYENKLTIDIENSEAIFFIGDSYTESDYTLPDKSYIAKVSEKVPYQIRNYSTSGNDAIEAINQIENNTLKFNSVYGIKDLKGKYAVIILYANDSAYRQWSIDMYKENIRQLVRRVQDMGMIPILSTEFFLYSYFITNDGVFDTALMLDLADELGIEFVDIAGTSLNFIKNIVSDFFYGSHPATRTNSILWRPLVNKLRALPNPRQSIKIYRNRAVESNFYYDTLFQNRDEMLEIYQEIRVGHNALTDANLIYFDRMGSVSNPIYETKNDEYLLLMNKDDVAFSRHALMEFTLPYMAKDVDYFRIKATCDKTVFAWIRKKITPWSNSKGTALRYTGSPTLNIGDEYLITSAEAKLNGKTFIVTDVRSGFVCADALTYDYPNLNASGTMALQSGTGSPSVSFDQAQACFEDAYYTQYDYMYQWVTAGSLKYDGYYYIDNTGKEYVEGDKVFFLIREVSGFNMSDVAIEIPYVEGAEKGQMNGLKPLERKQGTELLSQNKLGTTGELADWDTTGTVAVSQPIDSANPRGISGKVRLDGTNSVAQEINLTTDDTLTTKVQVRIWANYEPDKFVGSDLGTSPIDEVSFDESKLNIELYSDGVESIIIEKYVGLGFQEIVFDTVIPPDVVTPKIKLSATTKTVDVAFVSIIKLN